jgi:magnesium chelatase subunit D
VTFRGTEAHVALAPTASVELANLRLKELPVGGSTPLASGMLKALELLEAEMRRNQDTIPWLVILTDGRANVGLDGGLGSEDARAAAARVRASQVHALLLDTTSGGSGAAREIARLADSDYVRLASCDPATIRSAVLDHVRVVG